MFLGDSLTAGLGLPIDEAYPSLIARRLEARGQGWTVVNAGVSGDTSAGGVRRLDWALDGGAAVVVVALGGNDGLRGLPVEDLARNLDTIVGRAKAAGAAVVLAGMEAPPNTGPDYTRRFREVYPAVAARHQVTLLPFLLDGVAGEDGLNQADGIHPNREGARRVADVVWRDARAGDRGAREGPHRMIVLRGVVEDRGQRRPAADHPPSARSDRARRAVPGDRRARRAAARRRCSA